MKRPIYFQPQSLIFSVVMIAMAILSYRYDQRVFVFDIMAATISAALIIFMSLRYKRYVDRVVRDAVRGIKGVNHTYLEKFSVPVIVTGDKGDILWSNAKFRKKLCGNKECVGEPVTKYIPGTTIQNLLDSAGCDIEYETRRYTVLASAVDSGAVLYYIDNTELKNAAQMYDDSRPAVITVILDNREDFERNNSEESFTQAIVLLESAIKKWVQSFNGLYIKSAASRYKIVIDEKSLKKAIESKFKLLDEVRAIKIFDGSVVTTISMGIGHNASTDRKSVV